MPENKNEFRLEVGNAVIGIICPSEEFALSFEDYFGTQTSDRKPDITLELELLLHENEILLPDSLFTTKKVKGTEIDIAEGLVRIEPGNSNNNYKLFVKRGLTLGLSTRVFEQLLYQAFYTCCRIRDDDSILIHCSGVINRGSGYIFTGPSGAGKSTIASLSDGYHILNDEICLLEFKNSGVKLHSTPFNGYYKNKKSGMAHLKYIFLIAHGKEHRIVDLSKGDVVKLLSKEIVPPVTLDGELNTGTFINMLDITENLYNSVPIYRLEFLPDNGFWSEINRFENQKEV